MALTLVCQHSSITVESPEWHLQGVEDLPIVIIIKKEHLNVVYSASHVMSPDVM